MISLLIFLFPTSKVWAKPQSSFSYSKCSIPPKGLYCINLLRHIKLSEWSEYFTKKCVQIKKSPQVDKVQCHAMPDEGIKCAITSHHKGIHCYYPRFRSLPRFPINSNQISRISSIKYFLLIGIYFIWIQAWQVHIPSLTKYMHIRTYGGKVLSNSQP